MTNLVVVFFDENDINQHQMFFTTDGQICNPNGEIFRKITREKQHYIIFENIEELSSEQIEFFKDEEGYNLKKKGSFYHFKKLFTYNGGKYRLPARVLIKCDCDVDIEIKYFPNDEDYEDYEKRDLETDNLSYEGHNYYIPIIGSDEEIKILYDFFGAPQLSNFVEALTHNSNLYGMFGDFSFSPKISKDDHSDYGIVDDIEIIKLEETDIYLCDFDNESSVQMFSRYQNKEITGVILASELIYILKQSRNEFSHHQMVTLSLV